MRLTAKSNRPCDCTNEDVSWVMRVVLVLLVAALQLGNFYLGYRLYSVLNYSKYIDVETSLDHLIPYIRWSWVVYYFGFAYIIFWGAAGIWQMRKKALVRTIAVYCGMVVTGAALHLVIPTRAPWPLVQDLTTTQIAFKTAYSIKPLGCFPSMHVAMAVLPAFISLYAFRSHVTRIMSLLLALMVSGSVIIAKEHWALDLIGGLILGLASCYIWIRYAHELTPGAGLGQKAEEVVSEEVKVSE